MARRGFENNIMASDGVGDTSTPYALSSGVPTGHADRYFASNDLERLEKVAADELGPLDGRISRQLTGLEEIVDRKGEAGAVARAGADAISSSRRDEAQFERRTRGMDLSPRQQRAAGRRLGLARQLNRARAQGETRRGFTDRAAAAASQGGAIADSIFAQRLAGETNLASAYTTKKMADDNKQASKRQGRIAAVSQIAGAALAFFSSEKLKSDHGHEPALLDKLKRVRVNRWKYHGDNKTHVGPFAEEFNKEFGIDTDRPDMINVIDALGVTMGAVKELDRKVSQNV